MEVTGSVDSNWIPRQAWPCHFHKAGSASALIAQSKGEQDANVCGRQRACALV